MIAQALRNDLHEAIESGTRHPSSTRRHGVFVELESRRTGVDTLPLSTKQRSAKFAPTACCQWPVHQLTVLACIR